jgi:spore coat polysaccharide biosynthesis protein SpsF (cytidylyltransferase family)
MNNMKKMPFFHYHLLDMNGRNFKWITNGDEQIHKIADADEFYARLGYTEELRKGGTEAEVFVWQTYRADNSERAEVCLQANIIDYLNANSEEFRIVYMSIYDRWRGSCTSDNLRNTVDCNSCKMHKSN